jgi:hypothetical protein
VQKLILKGKYIPNSKCHKNPKILKLKSNDLFFKKCICSFTIKQMYFANMRQICYAIKKGSFSWDIHNQRCVAFVRHVLKGTKAFVMLEYLRLGLFVPPIYMAKHMCHVKKIMEANGMLLKYLFLCV